MKTLVLASALILAPMLSAQTPEPAKAAGQLISNVYTWEQLKVEPTKTGERRALFDGSTPVLSKLHCHITTLNPGEKSGDPRLHPQEEVIIVKEGTIEAFYDGNTRTATTGSVIFFQAGATTALRNPGSVPATYIVLYYHPLNAKP